MIRLAVGRWARAALARWHAQHPGFADVLIGETPFVGHRLVELARRDRDPAEAVLMAGWTRVSHYIPESQRMPRQTFCVISGDSSWGSP